MYVKNIYSILPVDDVSQVRKQAYTILSNKNTLKCRLVKTKMCNKVYCNRINCNYAHSFTELRVPDCVFGSECIYMSSKNKLCLFRHPCENKKQYIERVCKKKNCKKKLCV
jgi:hypothetical protein